MLISEPRSKNITKINGQINVNDDLSNHSLRYIIGLIISEASRRACSTRSQQVAKPGRQLITFLLFANITLWILDTFMTHNWITQEMQLSFYGLLAWGIISRISLPLLIFYRFDPTFS